MTHTPKTFIWLIACLLIVLTGSPIIPTKTSIPNALAANTNFLVSDAEMTDLTDMTLSELESFLMRGFLGTYHTTDLDGVERSAAEIIWRTSREFAISPRFIVVLLQREQSLITSKNPTQKQLDWALGYAVCDDCSMDDPRIQKFKGFPNQVYYATKRIRESYLTDLALTGQTISGIKLGVPVFIDGTEVIPANAATAALYTYTPHLHGNQNFVTIWQRWFTRTYPTGALLQNNEDGGVWYIQFGKKRPITSKTALYSRFNADNIIQVSPTALEPYDRGTPISFPNYSILQNENGTIYLLVDDVLRPFDSLATYKSLGFSPDELVSVPNAELAMYEIGLPITASNPSPQGRLVQDTTTGGVYFVHDGQKAPIVSRLIMTTRFPDWPIYPAKEGELVALPTAAPLMLPDGVLVGATGNPAIFLISEGTRRPIMSEAAFLSYGFKWTQIVWTDAKALERHPLGAPLDERTGFETPIDSNISVASTPSP